MTHNTSQPSSGTGNQDDVAWHCVCVYKGLGLRVMKLMGLRVMKLMIQ